MTVAGWSPPGANCGGSASLKAFDTYIQGWIIENIGKMPENQFRSKLQVLRAMRNDELPPFMSIPPKVKTGRAISGVKARGILTDSAIFVNNEFTMIRFICNTIPQTGTNLYISSNLREDGTMVTLSDVHKENDSYVARAISSNIPDNRLVQYTKGTEVSIVDTQVHHGRALSGIISTTPSGYVANIDFVRSVISGDQVFVATGKDGYQGVVDTISVDNRQVNIVFSHTASVNIGEAPIYVIRR